MNVFAIIFLELLALATIDMTFCNGSTHVGCIQSEREALLRFKQDLIDPSSRLASWTRTNGDCCTWPAVVCDNSTGHVLQLNFRYPNGDFFKYSDERSQLGGKINPSLLDLKHLTHLDLSSNNFIGTQIPSFFGSMVSLRYLNLSYSTFRGRIPSQLGNLSNLEYLSASGFYLYVENLSWLSGLSLLKELELSRTDLSQASDWLLEINTLRSLKVLKLKHCKLNHFPPLPVANFSSLDMLDLSTNRFNSIIPCWIFGLSDLVGLSLTSVGFEGPIFDGLQNLTYLRRLDFSSTPIHKISFESLRTSMGKLCNLRSIALVGIKLSEEISKVLNILAGCISYRLELLKLKNCELSGHLTDQLLQFNNLNSLDLSYNFIAGPIPLSLGELSPFMYLDLFNNKFNGTLSEPYFVNQRLVNFFVSGNSLMLKVNPQWVPPPQLESLGLGSCNLGLEFPSWIYSLKNLSYLDLYSTGILGTIPIEFWKFASQLIFLNLSHNQFHGGIPNLNKAINLQTIDLNSNNLSGQLPLVSYWVNVLDLSNNTFSGPISHFLCGEVNKSWEMCILEVDVNLLSGELPDCWKNLPSLFVLNLGDNKFIGKIPASMGTLNALWSLNLRRNGLFGTIFTSLENLTELRKLDIGENEFSGKVPEWIGERFSSISVLILSKNKLHGPLPAEFCHLSSLQILDLSHNTFSGDIPRCINNITATKTENQAIWEGKLIGFSTVYDISVVTSLDALVVLKGEERKYTTNLRFLRSIDFSLNKFSGEIPKEVIDLEKLQSLNLSHNCFVGRIPERIGAMTALESLDFSANQLSGEIPQSISNLTFLSTLNLSYNNLFGKIPLGTQLQTFDAASFIGNELCGSPLPENCTNTSEPENGEEEDDDEHEVDWFYVSMTLGFVIGFCSVISSLHFNRRWRYLYCHFLDCLGDKFGSFVRKCLLD